MGCLSFRAQAGGPTRAFFSRALAAYVRSGGPGRGSAFVRRGIDNDLMRGSIVGMGLAWRICDRVAPITPHSTLVVLVMNLFPFLLKLMRDSSAGLGSSFT